MNFKNTKRQYMTEKIKKQIYNQNHTLKKLGLGDLTVKPSKLKTKNQIKSAVSKQQRAIKYARKQAKNKNKSKEAQNTKVTSKYGFEMTKRSAKIFDNMVKKYNAKVGRALGGAKRRKDQGELLSYLKGEMIKIPGLGVTQGQALTKRSYSSKDLASQNHKDYATKGMKEFISSSTDEHVQKRGYDFRNLIMSQGIHYDSENEVKEFLKMYNNLSPYARAFFDEKSKKLKEVIGHGSPTQRILASLQMDSLADESETNNTLSPAEYKELINDLIAEMEIIQKEVDNFYKR